MAFFAIVLAVLATELDHWLGSQWISQSSFFLNSQAEGARAVLATIAGSMITVAGVTFSMTLVAVSFALGQIGPRLIRNFMQDKTNQFTLGTFIATFLYTILVLRTVSNASNANMGNSFVPHVAIFIAMLLAILSITVLIFFIHHIQKCINISEILGNIGGELIAQLSELSSIEETSSSKQYNETDISAFHNFRDSSNSIISKKNGHIKTINIKSIFKLATEKKCIIEITFQPGTFVSQTSTLLYVSKILDEDDQKILLDCFSIGPERDQDQDIYFLSDQISEIIARALSPGVNDPFTAISAINWLRCAIEALSRIKTIHPYQYDEKGNLRIIVHPISLTQFVNKVFGQIRAYVSSDFNTALHIMLLIKQMIQNSKNSTLTQLLHLHAGYFHMAAMENLGLKQDKEVLSKYIAEIIELK